MREHTHTHTLPALAKLIALNFNFVTTLCKCFLLRKLSVLTFEDFDVFIIINIFFFFFINIIFSISIINPNHINCLDFNFKKYKN